MKHYSLLEFNLLVKEVLAGNLALSYWIIAEIGQINRHTNGHCYLELVEKDNQYVKAKARGTIWANVFREIHPWFVSQTGTELKSGMKILLNASLEFHEVYGLSLNIKDVDANFTIGERERKKQETLQKLEREGIIDMNQTLTLPPVIQKLAIISSPSAAGYEDFTNQFENNPYQYQASMDLYPAVMQGDAAPHSIISSLHQINDSGKVYDAVVIIRGGGSKMDLDCFDDYELCSHLAQFPIPLITGIGHERDQSIADLVAHTNLKTPTSVAEFLVSTMLAFESEINRFHETIQLYARQTIQAEIKKVSESYFNYRMNAKQRLDRHSFQLERRIELIQSKPQEVLIKQLNHLNHTKNLVDACDPILLLKKGFSVTRLAGKVLKDQPVKPGDQLETETVNQKIISTVTEFK